MGINYPGTVDNFPVPSLPESTSLSSGGTADRAHTAHHRDLGLGLTAVMTHAALKTHLHQGTVGDPTGKLSQVNTHQNADTDLGTTSLHHTLGNGEFQAAPGNHIHDYTGTTITNKPIEICTSTARPVPFPGKMIWERDTNRMRVWAQFPGQRQAVSGLYFVDKFERSGPNNIGTGYNQSYTIASGAGKMVITDGHSINWVAQGDVANRCIARRTETATKHTNSFDQVITLTTNEHTASWANPNADNPNTNDAYFRMSDDGQTYVRAALTWWKGTEGSIMLTHTTSGPVGEQLIGQLPAKTDTPNIMWQLRMVGNLFEVYMGVQYVGSIQDNANVTATGYKGWGIGMQAGDGGFVQSLPNQIAEISVADAVYFTSSIDWQLLPVGQVPKVGLAATVPQMINPTGSLLEWDHVEEDNFNFFNDSGDDVSLLVSEAGVYHVHVSVIWNTQPTADRAVTAIMVNGLQTPHQHWEHIRGFNYVPQYAQTVDCTAYLRLAEGDRVSIAAAHNGWRPEPTGYKKNNDVQQLCRFFMVFITP